MDYNPPQQSGRTSLPLKTGLGQEVKFNRLSIMCDSSLTLFWNVTFLSSVFRQALIRGIFSNLNNSSKEIITVTEVWISDLTYHRFLRFYLSVYSLDFISVMRSYNKHLRQCFIRFPNTSNFVKNAPRLLSVFGNRMKHCIPCV